MKFLKKTFLLKHGEWERKISVLEIIAAIIAGFVIFLLTWAIMKWGFIPLIWLLFIWIKTEAKKLTIKFFLIQLGKRGLIDYGVMPLVKKHILPKVSGPAKLRFSHTWKSISTTFKVITATITGALGLVYVVFASGAKTLTAIVTFLLQKLGIAKLFSAILALLIKIKSYPLIGGPIKVLVDVIIFEYLVKGVSKVTPKRLKKYIKPIFTEIVTVLDKAIERIDNIFGTKVGALGDWLAKIIWDKTHDTEQKLLPAPKEVKLLTYVKEKKKDSNMTGLLHSYAIQARLPQWGLKSPHRAGFFYWI